MTEKDSLIKNVYPDLNQYDSTTVQPPKVPTPDYDVSNTKGNKIYDFINTYKINPLFSEKLDLLKNYKIVLLIDDSGSMNTKLSDSKYETRWDELKDVIKIVISITSIYNKNGIDVNFLNRRNYKNIKSIEEIQEIFNERPSGLTPLTSKLNDLFNNNSNSDKPLLIIIPTDGLPSENGENGETGEIEVKSFENLLKNRNSTKFLISFLACSNDEKEIGYLRKIKKKIKNISILSDYNSKFKEIATIENSNFKYTEDSNFKYTLGDHTIRLLLNPVCSEITSFEKKNLKKNLCNIL